MARSQLRGETTGSRRRFLALIVGGLGAVSLAACGATPASTTSTAAASTSSATATFTASSAASIATAATTKVALATTANTTTVKAAPAGTGQAVKITFSNPSNATFLAVDNWCIDEFNKTNPGIQAAYLNPPAGNDWTTWLQTQIAADLAPDVYYTNTSLFLDFVSKQNYRPLDAYIAKDSQFKISDLWPAMVNVFQWQGKQYALPKDNGSSMIYYNVDAFQSAGVPLPTKDWTWDTFLSAAQRLTKQSDPASSQFGFLLNPAINYWLPWVLQAGGTLFSSDLKQFLPNTAAAVEGMQYYADLVNKWHVAPTAAEQKVFPPGKQPFDVSKVAMYFGWPGDIARLQALTLHWDAQTPPIKVQHGTYVDGAGFFVGGKSKAPDAAWLMVRWWAGPVLQTYRTQHGIGVPSNKAVAQTFLDLGKTAPPANRQAFFDNLAQGISPQFPLGWAKLSSGLTPILNSLWAGQTGAQEAVSRMQALLNPQLQAQQAT
jgi:ABC-type glycerol-3-phosphate transport system substrate-binding protein